MPTSSAATIDLLVIGFMMLQSGPAPDFHAIRERHYGTGTKVTRFRCFANSSVRVDEHFSGGRFVIIMASGTRVDSRLCSFHGSVFSRVDSGSQGVTMSADAVTLYAALLRGEITGDAALQTAHRMLELVMDSIPQAIFWKDTDRAYLGCNKVFADLAGLEPGEVIGKSDLDMPWADHDAVHFRDWDQIVIDSGKPQFGIVERIHLQDGTALRMETNKVPLLDFDGVVVGILGTSADVSDRVQAEEELRQNLEELDERVHLRTAELSRANHILRREVDERVRLQAEERQQRAYAEAMRETAAAISRSLDLDDVLDDALVGVERLMSYDLGAAVLLDDENNPVLAHYRAQFGYRTSDIDLTLIAELEKPDEALLLVDIQSTEMDLANCRGLCPAAGSIVVAPMTVGGQLIGYLVAESATRGFFSDVHAERLQTVADQAAAAISNARLYSRAAELAAVDERQRLAHDLHDSVSQTLWTASLLSGSFSQADIPDDEVRKKMQSIEVLTKGALAEMRALLLELRPAALEEASLEDLMYQLVAAFESHIALNVNVGVSHIDSISIDAKLALYRIAQEALNNVARHANAKEVSLELAVRSRCIELTVTDDGCGYQADEVSSDHMGLVIMAERAEKVGGTLELETSPGAGSTVRIRVPLGTGW